MGHQAFIARLPDPQARVALAQLGIEVCIEGEGDEMWSFVGSKRNQVWLWYIIERRTRKVLAFTFGPRTDEIFCRLISLIPPYLLDHLATDDWGAYKRVPFRPFQ